VEGLSAGYGSSQALHAVSFELAAGEAMALLGRNGMGKTTTVRAIMGLLPNFGGNRRSGRIIFEGQSIEAWAPFRIARLGLGLVPEGRQVFPNLTVLENLTATARRSVQGQQRWDLPAIFALFPRLSERRNQLGRHLSGGEQQMLAIGRALMTNPRLLILDEATEGLAPLVRSEIWSVLATLRGEGQAILLIDKTLSAVLQLANRNVILEGGRSVWSGTSAALAAAADIRAAHLAI